MSGIVVGIDGSPHSQSALEWALTESALRHVPLTVMAVAPAAGSIWGITQQLDPAEETLAKLKQAAQALVDKVAAGHSGVTVTVHTVSGVAADELIKASEGADLVVVAARGAGGFARLTMGSVSSQVAHHAHCPVVVLPAGSAR
jgi:nucleotide-binding universal stress UspA family protein